MANFATAALVKAQAKLTGMFQSGELRFRDPAVHKLFLQNTSIMMPEYTTLRTREDRVVETNYAIRQSRALGSARSHNPTGAQGDSAVLTPSWSTYTDEIVSTLKEADNKIYSMDEMSMIKMQNVIANFAEGLDTAASTYAFSNRSGVNVATAEGTFDATDDVFQITDTTNGTRAIQITRMVMDINKWQGVAYDVICDSIAYNKFRYLAAQGTSNATNTSFQFEGVTFVHNPALTAQAAGLVGAYAKGAWIAVPRGTVAALDWIPVQNRIGIEKKEASYGNILNPVDALNYAVFSYEERVDGTSLGGYTQDVKVESQFSIDIAYQHAPLSVANETPLQMFALV